jgi:hypothetical protein
MKQFLVDANVVMRDAEEIERREIRRSQEIY